MAKLKTLQGAPKDFDLPVSLDNLDGSQSEIIFKCIGRTLRDWQPLYLQRLAGEVNAKIDAQDKLDQQAQAPEEGAKKSKKKEATSEAKRIAINEEEIRETLESSLNSPVEIIQEVARGWDLEDDFTSDNLKELINRYPGVQAKLFQQYHERILGNRVKN
ncbi:phage tail assembly chaperone [Lampropedia aestuarii]|uniref:phage tail assembly chaperone n=1 Tax=Lampropedia aestuarii TaxID=2562762 RepID=UPI00246871BC|nr:phage tail assembly chaperone [Lampropedia aestuarii]MDH5858990.1 phage tail assembly chaperone [Lampropedia aestuarii]